MHQVSFRGVLCNLIVSRYQVNNRVRWDLKAASDGSPYATVTVNVPDEALEDNQVHIKNHTENEGMLAALIEAGLVEPLSQYSQPAHVPIPIVTVLHEDLLEATS